VKPTSFAEAPEVSEAAPRRKRDAALALAAAWLERPGAEKRARDALAADPPGELAACALAHGVAAIFLEAATKLGAADQGLAPLRRAARTEAARSLALEPALEEIAERSREKGLRAMLVKGIALDRACYPRPGLRPATDLDLIIETKALPAWGEFLGELGYAKFPRVDRTWRRAEGETVDLHAKSSDLVGVIDVPDQLSPVQLDAAAVFSRAIEVPGVPLPVPCPEDHLIISAAHGLGVHVFERLMWLLDVVVLLGGELDAPRVADLARRSGAGRLLYHSLNLACELGLAEAPEELSSSLAPERQGRLERKLVARLARSALPEHAEFLLALALPAPRGYRRRLLRRALLPRRRTVRFGNTRAPRGALGHLGRALRLAWLATLG
jgi:hypothetical protein